MTLATRCPACGTVFRVVQDQLRVSQGWVRCGRCAEAFNATESMVEAPAPHPVDVVLDPEQRTTANSASQQQLPAGPEAEPGLLSAQTATPGLADADANNLSTSGGLPPDTPTGPGLPTDLPPAPPLIELPPGVEVVASDGALAQGLLMASPAPARTDPDFGFEALADAPPPVAPMPPDPPLVEPAAPTAAPADGAMVIGSRSGTTASMRSLRTESAFVVTRFIGFCSGTTA